MLSKTIFKHLHATKQSKEYVMSNNIKISNLSLNIYSKSDTRTVLTQQYHQLRLLSTLSSSNNNNNINNSNPAVSLTSGTGQYEMLFPVITQRRTIHTNEAPTVGSTPTVSDSDSVIDVNSDNLNRVLSSPIPTILYFHVVNNDTVAEYTRNVTEAVIGVNKECKPSTGADSEKSNKNISIRLAKVDCLKEMVIAQQFNVNPEKFPLMLFISNQEIIDQFIGIPPVAQIRVIIEAFLKHCDEEKKLMAGEIDTPMSSDNNNNNNNNVTELISMAQKKLDDKDYIKSLELYEQAVYISRVKVKETKQRLGLDKKKMTPELLDKLKQDPHYFALAKALAGTAMVHCAQKQMDKAKSISNIVREEVPSAVKEVREVAMAIVWVDMAILVDYDPLEEGSYDSVVSQQEDIIALKDPVALYKYNIKLAAAHYFGNHYKAAIDVCLSMIRTEPKLLNDLREAGIVAKDVTMSTSGSSATPARRIIFLIFEALGNTHEDVVVGRKRLTAYLSI